MEGEKLWYLYFSLIYLFIKYYTVQLPDSKNTTMFIVLQNRIIAIYLITNYPGEKICDSMIRTASQSSSQPKLQV